MFSVARWSDRGLMTMFETDDDLFDSACALSHLDEMDGVTLEIVSVVDG